MKILSEIQQLLENPGYGPAATAQARALCRRLGLPEYGNKQELFTRLEEAAARISKFQPPEKANTDRAPVKPGKAPEPDGIEALKMRARSLHKQQAFVHAQLTFFANEPESADRQSKLFDLARALMEEITPALDLIYDQIREFEETGRLPNDPSFLEGQAVAKKIHSLRTSISRYRGLIKRTQDRKKRGEYLDKIDALEEEMRALMD